ncbi:MAG TPA: type II secretion system F family protein [Polyangia bacterium]|jgi:tight adherence protein B|nr:type II secretion system F family protein [Polyangia bacterium]
MRVAGIPFSTIMLFLAVGAGTLAVLLGVLHGWTPFWTLWKQKWRAYEKWANDELRALYSPLRAKDFAIRHAAVIAAGLLTGGVILDSWIYGIILAAFFAYVPVLWMERQKSQRRKALNEQLDATLQSMANTILVTQNLEDAFATIAQHFDPPISQEADIVVKQVRLGTPMDEALRDFSTRCHSRNVDAIVTALTVGRQTGGELPKVLETTASVLRETMRVEGVMESKTSEGKAQVWVMGMLPFVFGGALQVIDPEWMQPLFKDPIGWAILLVVCFLEAIGIALVRKFTRIDV